MSKATTEMVDQIADECVGARIRILARAISSIYDDSLRPFGIRFSQMNILVVTAKLGTVRQADVCNALQMDHSTVSRNVERMCTSGWLEKISDVDDGRAMPFQVTTEGKRLIRKAFPAWEHAQTSIARILGDDAAKLLKRSVIRIREANS